MVDKLFVIGLDSAPPELLFERFIDDLPNIKGIISKSVYGPMKSCIPAITIPAWMVMATGKSPGELGLYGFRHRKEGTYNDMWIANSRKVSEPAVWDYLGMEGLKSILVGVPPSYPPKKVNGQLISCFITPDSSKSYTYPESLKGEVEDLVGEYVFDVVFRKDDRDAVREAIWSMTRKRFEVIRHLIQEKEWNYFQFVDIGLDRVHHAFWKYFDEEHHLHEPDSKYAGVIKEYYELLDREIGETLELLDDDTGVAIVSDHGIKRMKGAFSVNQWLIDEGYLKVNNPEVLEQGKQVGLDDLDVDWSETVAWAWGGYYSRVFLNVEAREVNGRIPMSEYYSVRDELAEALRGIRGPNGEEWNTRVFYPEDIYSPALGDKPDLMVYFDDLYWRAAGTLGHPSNYLERNDTGPDDAMHSEYGVFALSLPGMTGSRWVESSIYDFAPTVLDVFDIGVPLDGVSLL